jgi:hypothetical protein
MLQHSDDYDEYLNNSAANQRQNPLVRFAKNCEKVRRDHRHDRDRLGPDEGPRP